MNISLDGARSWQEKLAALGHVISLREAFDVSTWFELRNGPLILQGEPGCGKTRLLKRVGEASGATQHWLRCYERVGAGAALYSWNKPAQARAAIRAERAGEHFNWWADEFLVNGKMAQALLDPAPLVLAAIDEIDKIAEGSELEAALLEFVEEQTITINESGSILRRPEGLPPLLIGFTSNAAPGSVRESLSKPLLRRGKMVRFQHPAAASMERIIQRAVPNLNAQVRREVSCFVEALRGEGWEKPISLSEGILWARTLSSVGCTELNAEVVEWTSADLAKGEQEKEALGLATKRLLRNVKGATNGHDEAFVSCCDVTTELAANHQRSDAHAPYTPHRAADRTDRAPLQSAAVARPGSDAPGVGVSR